MPFLHQDFSLYISHRPAERPPETYRLALAPIGSENAGGEEQEDPRSREDGT